MPGQNPYYLAVKISPSDIKESDTKYLLLTDVPCTEPWSEQINRISVCDPRLVIKFTQTGAFTYSIYRCDTASQIMYAINVWLDYASLSNIILIASEFMDNPRVCNMIFKRMHDLLDKKILYRILPNQEFTVNQIYWNFASRKFPISERSSESWKKLFIESFDDSSSYLIKIAKKIVLTSGSETDNYPIITKEPEKDAIEKYGGSIDNLLNIVNDIAFKPQLKQFLAWVKDNYKMYSPKLQTQIFNMCVTLIKSGKLPSFGEKPKESNKLIQPQIQDIGEIERSEILSALNMLMSTGQDMTFVEFTCALLSCERYLFLLQLPRIMYHLTGCMKRDRRFTNLIAYAMSFAMCYAEQIESTSYTGSTTSPFVFSHESIYSFPIFDDITPYVPVGVEKINHNVPFRVPGERRPVMLDEIPERLNNAMVRQDMKFDMLADIDYHSDNLILTGSRYASALWIGPRERELYGGDYRRYVKEYIGHSCEILDEILANVDTAGSPLLDIVGRDFTKDESSLSASSDYDPSETKVDAKMSSEFDSLFPDLKPVATEISAAIEISEPPIPVDVKQNEINQQVRNLFCKLKFAPGFDSHSDIDIGHIGSQDDFDSAAARLVTSLRKFGRAIALRFQKPRNYTWTIVTDFLNFTIDFFHIHNGSGTNLVLHYMTSYPRCWYDGSSHFGTVEYVCARMSGINSRYIYTMNDPIYTLMKCARREDISILLNFGEQTMVKKWLAINMPGVKTIFGNVSLTNDFFRTCPDGIERDNTPKPWIFNPPVMPKSREKLRIWSKVNDGQLIADGKLLIGKKITVAKPAVFGLYMTELRQLEDESSDRYKSNQ